MYCTLLNGLWFFKLTVWFGCFNILVGVRCFCGRNGLGFNRPEGLGVSLDCNVLGGSFDCEVSYM